jgi:hypothetical protein
MITRLVLDLPLVTAGIMRWHGWQTGVLRAPIVHYALAVVCVLVAAVLAATAMSAVAVEWRLARPLDTFDLGYQHVVRVGLFVLLGALVARPPAFQRSVGDSPGR